MINWTPDLDAEMRSAVASGVSYSEFAAARGMTRSQALSRALRLRRAGVVGFELRVQVENPAHAQKIPRAPKVPASAKVASPSDRTIRVKPKGTWQPESDRLWGLPLWDVVSPDRVGIGKEMIHLWQGDCRWLAASGLYCGQTVYQRSYCAFHFGLVYQTSRKALNVSNFKRQASITDRKEG